MPDNSLVKLKTAVLIAKNITSQKRNDLYNLAQDCLLFYSFYKIAVADTLNLEFRTVIDTADSLKKWKSFQGRNI